jgi:Xaa-Pro aminopeptidase
MMGFEPLTLAPIDRHLIDVTQLTADERDWLNDYHRRVLQVIGPQLDSGAARWLKTACKPL